MAREARGTVDDEVDFIPSIDGNRDDPDPFTVTIKPLTAGELAKIERGMGNFSGHKVNFTERAQAHVKMIFERRVVSVRGYSIVHPKTGAKIEPKTGPELYTAIMDHGDDHETDIIDEIVAAVKDASKLREGLRER